MDQIQPVPRAPDEVQSQRGAIGTRRAWHVYGDIGTSPLYALKVAVQAAGETPRPHVRPRPGKAVS